MGIKDLEAALRDAQARQSKAIAALAPKHRGGEVEEFNAARAAVLQAERNLAAAKGEEYAVPVEFPVRWDTGAPLPYLLQNDYRTFLAFFLHTVDPNWDGTYVKVREPSSELSEELALVEFERCACTKMGTPNDEVLQGHRLYGKGLAGYQAMAVENSTWLRELEKINSVHDAYKPESWRGLKHYILPFHDSTFECVARGFRVETFQMPLSDLLSDVKHRRNQMFEGLFQPMTRIRNTCHRLCSKHGTWTLRKTRKWTADCSVCGRRHWWIRASPCMVGHLTPKLMLRMRHASCKAEFPQLMANESE